jgi:hypothetical protein
MHARTGLLALARQGLTQPQTGEPPRYRGGFQLLPPTEKIITSKMVHQWLEEEAH